MASWFIRFLCLFAFSHGAVGYISFYTPWASNHSPPPNDIELIPDDVCGNGVAAEAIEVREVGTTAVLIISSQTVETSPKFGLKCDNTQQPASETCDDYECRYTYSDGSDSGFVNNGIPTAEGEREIAVKKKKERVVKVECHDTVTGGNFVHIVDNVRFGPNYGFRCFNGGQPGEFCLDYETRYYCHDYYL